MTIIMRNEAEITKIYVIHKEIACYYSPMLDKAFNGPFTEGDTQTLIIDDFDYPDAFGAVQSWMYTQSMNGWEAAWGREYTKTLYIVWILADRLLMPNLQNELMGHLWKNSLPLRIFDYVYENTGPRSKLRKYIADTMAGYKCPDDYRPGPKQCTKLLPVDLLVDIIAATRRPEPPTPQNFRLQDFLVEED